MKKIIDFYRVDEWFDSKIPFSLCVFAYFFVTEPSRYPDLWHNLYVFLLLILAYALFLAFSYSINDYSDAEIDRQAGKQKVMHTMPKSEVILLIAGSFFGGACCFLALNFSLSTLIETTTMYALSWSYSMRPFRFKEKGLFGLLECSLAQRVLPLIIVLDVLNIRNMQGVLWATMSMLVGLRYILVHQIMDYHNDKESGIKTFATEKISQAKILTLISFLLEVAIITALLWHLSQHFLMPTLIFLFLFLFLFAISTFAMLKYIKISLFFSFIYFPLEDFYNYDLFLFLGVMLCLQNTSWIPVIMVVLLMLLKKIITKLAIAWLPIKIKWGWTPSEH